MSNADEDADGGLERLAAVVRHYRLRAEPGRFEVRGGDADLRVVCAPQEISAVGDASLPAFGASGVGHVSAPPDGVSLKTTGVVGSSGELLLGAVVELGEAVAEGVIVAAVTLPWPHLVAELRRDPEFLFRFNPRKMEELVAAAYEDSGEFDEVILTPRSGDKGRDVIAVRRGQFSVRFLDQVKRYDPGRRVPADDVRAMYGVLAMDQRASKAYITTTSEFAPRVAEEFAPLMPSRLQLRDGPALVAWFEELALTRR